MREVGLLEVVTDARGAVGRPQHRYSLAADAPALGFEPPAFPVLARMLLRLAATAGLPAGGRHRRRSRPGRRRPPAGSTRSAAVRGGPLSPSWPPGVRPRVRRRRAGRHASRFTRCPFRELAEANPELVCGLHRGLVEGFVAARGDGEVTAFHDLADRIPCQVEIARSAR